MQLYKHRQVGTLILFALGFGVVLTAILFILVPEGRVVTGLVPVILLLCILLFHSLTVEVNVDDLIVSFGPGVIRKRFRIADIHDARIVKNPWYYGWGIRLTPHGWLFNVSGFNAVELELKNNRKFRIGTDDPQRLITSIQTACQLIRSYTVRSAARVREEWQDSEARSARQWPVSGRSNGQRTSSPSAIATG